MGMIDLDKVIRGLTAICEDEEICMLHKDYADVCDDAIELLLHQVPEHPKTYPPTRYADRLYGCGACGHVLAEGRPKYCYECGKPVDWFGVK